MAIAADQHGRRQPANHEPAREFLVFVEQHREIDPEMVEELLNALRIQVRGNRDDAELRRIDLTAGMS